MIGPEDIRAKAERLYAKYLSSIVTDENIFPLNLPFAKVRSGEVAARWSELRKELARLKECSDEKNPGRSYRVYWEERRDKLAGCQSFPVAIFFPDEAAFLGYIGKIRESERFRVDFELLLDAFPVLKAWIQKNPLTIVERSGEWPRIIAVLSWFKTNPSSRLYIREIPAVEDTKFIETRKGLIRELLDLISPHSEYSDIHGCIDRPVISFEERCGLRIPLPLVRVRILDNSIAETRFSGIDDISLPTDVIARLGFPEFERVLVVENKTVFLTIPVMRGTLAVFGAGYASRCLGSVFWMASRRVGYWGDIDSHGFRILGAFREAFPQAEAILMDAETFDRFSEYRSDAPIDVAEEPIGLTENERRLFGRIISLTKQNRLEQERVPYEYSRQRLISWAAGE